MCFKVAPEDFLKLQYHEMFMLRAISDWLILYVNTFRGFPLINKNDAS